MRFFLILLAIVVVALAGLYVYGNILEPETQMITKEAIVD